MVSVVRCWKAEYQKCNLISVTGCRIQDKYQTYQDIVNYLNQYTHTLWDWKYRSDH